MQLSKNTLSQVSHASLSVPASSYFDLPEKVLQFGTGVLLRGLCDYYIDKANKQGVFNGRIVVVKSTDRGGADEFAVQDNLYTHCIKGYRGDELVQEYILNASLSRVLSAKQQWNDILACAANPDMEIIISNTTEVGIVLVENDRIDNGVPVSFPAKLLAFLYKRYRVFNGDNAKGMVIVPTELITGNGDKLREIVLQLAASNQLEAAFVTWLKEANIFCNSLVDRIVPGKLPAEELQSTQKLLGYKDDLSIMSEVYSLWAIEAQDEKVKQVLSFAAADETVVITPDIERFRELKLRLLNGTHTFSCGLAYLLGFTTVKEAMANSQMERFIRTLSLTEMAPCITGDMISAEEAETFAGSVLDRFKNPYINHQWISITLNYTQKMRMRNVPMIVKHYQRDLYVPSCMALGFAAYLVFMKCNKADDGKYYGEWNGKQYLIQDEAAPFFAEAWQQNDAAAVATQTLASTALWGEDLFSLPGFAFAVREYMEMIEDGRAADAVQDIFAKRGNTV